MLEMKEKKSIKNDSSRPRMVPHAMKRLGLIFSKKKEKFKTQTINLIGFIKSS